MFQFCNYIVILYCFGFMYLRLSLKSNTLWWLDSGQTALPDKIRIIDRQIWRGLPKWVTSRIKGPLKKGQKKVWVLRRQEIGWEWAMFLRKLFMLFKYETDIIFDLVWKYCAGADFDLMMMTRKKVMMKMMTSRRKLREKRLGKKTEAGV